MNKTVLLITPPFTQLNTPYPATAYLKGFLNTRYISSYQVDLGIEVIIKLFSKSGLTLLFNSLAEKEQSNEIKTLLYLSNDYINTINPVISFLQGKQPTLAHRIANRGFLPEGNRFQQIEDVDWAFGNMGIHDKAKYLATMYLEDISDIITTYIDTHFGFSRYAERLGRSANSFDELYAALNAPLSFIDKILIEILAEKVALVQPELVAISIPFPGNLYAGFRCAQWIKQFFPSAKTAMGGGFANTELRDVADPRVFEFFDFITLDDGEAPIEQLVKYIQQNENVTSLKRTFTLVNNTVTYFNNAACADYNQAAVGTPDYGDLPLDKYIAAIEIINPMHSLWSNGRWNKLTMAHGCYWGKCTFCDISLNYIEAYEPLTAAIICDRMQQIINETGETGFHFVDEAAPPALMRAVAIEIIKRKMVVSWWTNIRFEKSFTRDLCLLLRESGCIGVSGGLEVASDRLLELIQKGVTVEQVARVNKNFTDAGIMVHAYLMYGFPTQTAQETIDSLEMVRQLFEAGILQSGFWHQFAMTAHSPVGLYPEKFNVQKLNENKGSFANNDLEHADPTGANHGTFSEGLKVSLINYMQGVGFDIPLKEWFTMNTPATTIPKDYINKIVTLQPISIPADTTRILFIGNQPELLFSKKTKRGVEFAMATLQFTTRTETIAIKLNNDEGMWLANRLQEASIENDLNPKLGDWRALYSAERLGDFDLFWNNPPVNQLFKVGLLQL